MKIQTVLFKSSSRPIGFKSRFVFSFERIEEVLVDQRNRIHP